MPRPKKQELTPAHDARTSINVTIQNLTRRCEAALGCATLVLTRADLEAHLTDEGLDELVASLEHLRAASELAQRLERRQAESS